MYGVLLIRNRRREMREHLEPEKVITFENPIMMVACFTAQRLRLVETARKKKLSISALQRNWAATAEQ